LFHQAMKKYVPTGDASAASLEGFVNAVIIVEGLRRAGRGLSREKFIEALESMRDFDSGLGNDFRAHYGPGDHKAFDNLYFSVIRNGKAVPLNAWKELRRTKP